MQVARPLFVPFPSVRPAILAPQRPARAEIRDASEAQAEAAHESRLEGDSESLEWLDIVERALVAERAEVEMAASKKARSSLREHKVQKLLGAYKRSAAVAKVRAQARIRSRVQSFKSERQNELVLEQVRSSAPAIASLHTPAAPPRPGLNPASLRRVCYPTDPAYGAALAPLVPSNKSPLSLLSPAARAALSTHHAIESVRFPLHPAPPSRRPARKQQLSRTKELVEAQAAAREHHAAQMEMARESNQLTLDFVGDAFEQHLEDRIVDARDVAQMRVQVPSRRVE